MMGSSQMDASLVRVARVGKPHGIRGEVTVEVFTDSPETRFVRGSILTVGASSNTVSSLTVQNSRWNKKILLLKFFEVDDRNTAEALRNAELYAPPYEVTTDEEGWYSEDLIGLPVHENELESPRIGEVSDLFTGEVQDLLEIRLSDGREVLVPFVEEIVPVVDENRGIVITPPPGLLELNQD